MATVNQPNDPNSPTQPGQPVQTGGSGGAGSASGAQAQAGTPSSPVQQNVNPSQSSSFNDVSAYLNANQQGGNQLGNQVAQNVTNQYNTTKSGIDTSANSAIQSANSGYVPENTQLIQQVASNPTQAANDTGTVNSFQAQLNDQYTGPSNYADLGTQQGNIATAQQYGNLINTPGGANVLTNQVENQLNPGQSSQGINTLDTLLLTGNPNATQAVQTAAQPYNTLGDYLNTQAGNVNNAITAGQTGAAQTSQDALNAFTGANGTLTNLNTGINNTVATDLSQAQAQQAALQADLSNLYGGVAQNATPSTLQGFGVGNSTPWYNTQNYTVGNLSPQDLQALGMTQDQWNALQSGLTQAGTSQYSTVGNFGAGSPTEQIALNQYLTQQDPTKAITAGTVATPQQYQEMAAINQLLGSQAPTQTEAINPGLASLAGTYNPATNLNTFDYNSALTNAQQVAAAERAAAATKANDLNTQADTEHAAGQHGGMFSSFDNFLNSIKAPVANPALFLGQKTLQGANQLKQKV
jgi:hypothetical protein